VFIAVFKSDKTLFILSVFLRPFVRHRKSEPSDTISRASGGRTYCSEDDHDEVSSERIAP